MSEDLVLRERFSLGPSRGPDCEERPRGSSKEVAAKPQRKPGAKFLDLLTQGEDLFGQLRSAYEAEFAATFVRSCFEESSEETRKVNIEERRSANAEPVKASSMPRLVIAPGLSAGSSAGALPSAAARLSAECEPKRIQSYSGATSAQKCEHEVSTGIAILMELGVRECYLSSPSDRVRDVSRAGGASENIIEYAEEDDPVTEGAGHRWMFYPNSMIRMYWDVIGGLVLLWDMIIIPMGAFKDFDYGVYVVMDHVTLYFWTCDMILAFFTGSVVDARIVLDHREIAVAYLKGWFLLDCVVVLPDWIFLFTGAQGGQGKTFEFFKTLRMLRIARLLRVAKLKRVLNQLQDRINSEYMSVVITILKLFMFMLAINHFVGCLWYYVGYQGLKYQDRNWVTRYVESETVPYKYVTSLHWSLTQFTPGSMQVQPQNLAERVVAVVVLLSGMVVFSSFVSSITGAMTALRGLQENNWKQTWMLRRYLRERGVLTSSPLYFRIQRYAAWSAAKKKGRVQESQVQLLGDLSVQLRNELQVETLMTPLKMHPLIAKVSEMSRRVMLKLANQGVKQANLARDDSQFYEGERASKLVVVQTGKLNYSSKHGQVADAECVSILVDAGIWVCEMALWTDWIHRGQLRVVEECDLIQVSADQFGEIVRQEPNIWHLVREHAVCFMMWLEEREGMCDLDTPCVGRQAQAGWQKTLRERMDPDVLEMIGTSDHSTSIVEAGVGMMKKISTRP